MSQIIVDETVLNEIVQRLVDAVDPDRIILFGSRARGDARADSDVDLLIIKDSAEPAYRRTLPAYRALAGITVPTDIIWRTAAEVEDWSAVRNYVTTRALNEGRVLYEKRS
jgi:predicted nucleotidyltransferase